MTIKQRIAKWLDIEWVSTRMPSGEFIGTKHLQAMGNQVSEGIKAGLEEQPKNAFSIPGDISAINTQQVPYTVWAILKDSELMEVIEGETDIPIEKLCQSLTDGTQGVKIGDYLIPTKEIRYFKIKEQTKKEALKTEDTHISKVLEAAKHELEDLQDKTSRGWPFGDNERHILRKAKNCIEAALVLSEIDENE